MISNTYFLLSLFTQYSHKNKTTLRDLLRILYSENQAYNEENCKPKQRFYYSKFTWYNKENCWTNKSFTCLPLHTDDHILKWSSALDTSVIRNRPSQIHCLNSDGTGDLSLLRYKPDFVTSLFVINELYCTLVSI
jgi:hypothetical protein